MHLGAELLRSEQHQPQVPPPLRDVQQHLANVGVGPVAGSVLVQLIDEHDHVVDTQLSALELLPQHGNNAREHEILRDLVHSCDVEHVDGTILERAEWQVAHRAVRGNEPLAARRDVQQSVAHLADGRDVMRAPDVRAAGLLETVEDAAKQTIEIAEGTDAMHAAPLVPELLLDHAVGQEIEEGVRLGVEVITVEQHLVIAEHLAEPPHQRLHRSDQIGVRPQGVEVHPVSLERGKVPYAIERPRVDSHYVVELFICGSEGRRLVEEAQVGAFHVEAHGRDRAFVFW